MKKNQTPSENWCSVPGHFASHLLTRSITHTKRTEHFTFLLPSPYGTKLLVKGNVFLEGHTDS